MALHVQRRGDGPAPLILLHGFLGSGRNLGSLARRWSELDASRTLLLADLTGHGHSPPLPPHPTIDDLARDVADLAREHGAHEIVGHSLGGRVALRARGLAGDVIESVVLLDISPAPTTGIGSNLQAVLDAFLAAPATAPSRDAMAAHLRAAPIPEALAQWLLLNLDRADDGSVTWRVDRDRLEALHHQSGAVDLWDTLADGPTRCIRGAASPFVSDADVDRMVHAACRVDTVPNAGHFIHVDNPTELLRLLIP